MESEFPITYEFTQSLGVKGDDINLYLFVIEYSNAVQLSIYDTQPKLGSMSLSYPHQDDTKRQSIFGGKHQQFADMAALVVGRQLEKLVYASVNISKDIPLNMDLIKELLDQYLESLKSS